MPEGKDWKGQPKIQQMIQKLTDCKELLLGMNIMSSFFKKGKHARQSEGFLSFPEMGWKHWRAIGVLCLLFVVGFWQGHNVSTPTGKNSIVVQVEAGMSSKEIAAELLARGVIKSKYKFWLLVKFEGVEDKFRTGRYVFRPNMDEREIIQKLTQGSVATVKFVIPEGFTVRDIAKRLDAEGIVDEKVFLEKAKKYAPYSYIEKRSQAKFYAEGFLFPDTYEVSTGANEEEILKLMSENLDERLTDKLRAQAKQKGLPIYDLITLASLVEKEARYDEDRAIIAQVFLKRLKVGMPLQSDATLQYLMDAPKEDVSIEDTKIDSPYNSYQHDGLPPTPIANPGMASIVAVLAPADTDYLYFVADRDGHNHYSKTYQEHLELVQTYR